MFRLEVHLTYSSFAGMDVGTEFADVVLTCRVQLWV